MNDKLDGVGVFVAVAEAGSFAMAAQRLGVTRSAVGKQVARLEQRLGVRLFHRTTRRQSLTDDGQSYYEHCVRALAELAAAEAGFESGRCEPSGRLRVSVPVLFGRHCVAPVLQALAQRHPALEVEVCFSDRIVDLVEDGFDLAVRVGPLPDTTALAARRLGVQHMSICAAPAYLARHGHPRSVADLDGHAGIAYVRAGRPMPWLLRGEDGAPVESRIASRLRFDDLQAIADAAIAGAGLAWLPCWLVAPALRDGRLALVSGDDAVVPADIHALWPHSRRLPLRVRVAIDALVEELPRRLAHA